MRIKCLLKNDFNKYVELFNLFKGILYSIQIHFTNIFKINFLKNITFQMDLLLN